MVWTDGDSAAKTISPELIDDADYESQESFTLQLDDPSGGASLGTPATTTVNIDDGGENGQPFSDGSGSFTPATLLMLLLPLLWGRRRYRGAM